jgi:phosphomannomutase
LQPVTELAASCRHRGLTVLDRLEALYRKYGLFLTTQRSLALSPGAAELGIGGKLRSSPPKSIGGLAIYSTLDVEAGVRRFADGRAEFAGLPPSDVLVYELDGGVRVTVRPSGTEPKIKCYYEAREKVAPGETLAVAESRVRSVLDRVVEAHQKELGA